MAPASVAHGRLQARIASLLDRHLSDSGSSCEVYTETAVIPHLWSNANLRIPDVVVSCSPAEPNQAAIADPVLLVEVLSPNNQTNTRDNVAAYSSIPALREILLVHSTRLMAELLRRSPEGVWPADPEADGSRRNVAA